MPDDKYLGKYRNSTFRAQWHNYDGGFYFVTICTKDRMHYFGEIEHDENGNPIMNLSQIGKIAQECWMAIPQHFPHIKTPLWVVMPDHIHGIVIINDIVRSQNFAPPQHKNKYGPQSKNLASAIRGFKIGVTKYARENNIPFQWQRLFHDHIIRDSNEMNHIAEYIENNVAKWEFDKNHK